jgi:predicted GTPase
VDHNNIQKQGSDILQALQETAHHFGSGNKKKILLLLSDGSDSNLQLPTELINQYKNLDIKVVVCGFGTVQ